jgi:hypothetical protein
MHVGPFVSLFNWSCEGMKFVLGLLSNFNWVDGWGRICGGSFVKF